MLGTAGKLMFSKQRIPAKISKDQLCAYTWYHPEDQPRAMTYGEKNSKESLMSARLNEDSCYNQIFVRFLRSKNVVVQIELSRV